MINVDGKIGSKAIAARLQKLLPELIHFNLNAYVKAREDKGVRELISHISPIPVLIPLKLFLVTKFNFQNVKSFEWINIFH